MRETQGRANPGVVKDLLARAAAANQSG
jgi:hypothetical protein